jgi:hypothetical protein
MRGGKKMNPTRRLSVYLLLLCLTLIMVIPVARAQMKYRPERLQFKKEAFDDPTPYLKVYGPKQIMPPEEYAKLSFDIGVMKKKWAEVVGFKAPDVVGKIAPEIKPGKYSYKDKDKFPGLKELMIPNHYERFKPAGPPYALNFSEMEVVPTQQIWYYPPLAEATLKNMGKTKQDDQGYMIDETYEAGFPFPRPSGKFKAQQIMYNWVQRYLGGEQCFGLYKLVYVDRNLNTYSDVPGEYWGMKLKGRTLQPPYGYLDERAKKRDEERIACHKFFGPRDQAGNVIWTLVMGGQNVNQKMIWLASIRRIRKISGTDLQECVIGANSIMDDYEGYSQKMSPTVYPYKYEVIAEREFLFPHYSQDGAEYVSSKGCEYKNLRMERRPMYVLQLTQQDHSYCYGRRIIYVDKETFLICRVENFDQKGRLWRAHELYYQYRPELGYIHFLVFADCDFVDKQSGFGFQLSTPVTWLTREDFDLLSLQKKGK